MFPARDSIRRPHVPAIRILPTDTVNRIAAGEVIERPAAAVKELVENALDAGATRIAVALDNGGIDRIEVTDDGAGMTADELALAVLRHATSKLPAGDLTAIATLGFRGEALPSIGAAARLAITSRPHDADHACVITVEGGQVSAVTPAPGPVGTRVVVRDLFYATPARRKFLKHPRTEADQAEAAVRRLALAAPGVAFRLESGGRTGFDLPAQDRAARVAALLGPEAAAALLPITGERGPLRLEGFACAPTVTRATGAAQALTVNNRPVTDPMLKAAVRVAYRDVIAAGRHPIVALFLEIPPEEVDVNVHPTKAELRFRDPGAVRALLIGSLQRALAGGAGSDVPAPRVAPRPVAAPGLFPAAADRRHPRPAAARPGRRATAAAGRPGRPPARPACRSRAPEHPLGAPVAQVLDTYVLAVAADGVAGGGGPARRARTPHARDDPQPDGGGRRPLPAAAAAGGGGAAALRRRPPAGPRRRSSAGSAWSWRSSGRARCWCARCPPSSAIRSRRRCCATWPMSWRSSRRARRWRRGWMRWSRGWPAMARSGPGGG